MVKYYKIADGYLAMIFTAAGVVKGIGKTKFAALVAARAMCK